MYGNSKEQTDILSKLTAETTQLSFEANQRLHTLVARYNELQKTLKPPSESEPIKQQEMPINPLEENEKTYCSNCGAPNGHNNMNGKPWCFKCNKPLKITYKKPQTTWTPKFSSVYVEKAEIEEFKSKQKQLSILSDAQ